MMRRAAIVAVLLSACASGCVERQMTLVTDPPGARAYYNNKYVGETPVTFHFTYYQSPGLRFEKEGYKSLEAAPKVTPPVYERFPLDFFAEALPLRIYDRHKFIYELQKEAKPDIDALVKRADELRTETTSGK